MGPAFLAVMLLHIVVSVGRLAGSPHHIGAQVIALLSLLALLWTVTVVLRFATARVERRFWRLVLLACSFAALSKTLEILDLTLRPVPGGPLISAALVLDGLTVAAFVALLASLARFRHSTWAARARFTVDIVAACVVAVALVNDWVLGAIFGTGPITGIVGRMLPVYPVVGVLLVFGTFGVVVGTQHQRWASWERLIAAAALVFAVGLVLSPTAQSEIALQITGGWALVLVDGLLLSAVLFALGAAVVRIDERTVPWRIKPLATIEPSYGWIAAVLLPAVELLAIPAFGIGAFLTPDLGGATFRLWALGIVSCALVLRTILAVWDSEILLRRADMDSLTGLLNYKLFHEYLDSEIEHATRRGHSVGLVAVDVDDFGDVNTRAGHLEGDRVLVAIARAVESAVRGQDLVCRVGGDELMIILPAAELGGMVQTAERVLGVLRDVCDVTGHSLSASIGVAAYPDHAPDADQLVRAADAALYWAKRNGKDRSMLYDPDVVVPVSHERRLQDLRAGANAAVVRALTSAADARDPGAHAHAQSVSELSVRLARALGLDEETVTGLGHAGLLHDVGKVGVPDAVLRMPGVLDDSERARLREHAPLGGKILAATAMTDVPSWVCYHHEWWDGSGHPDGLEGESIPLGARIIAIAEAYDSLLTGRSGRAALSSSAACERIGEELGTKFDPALGEVFLRMMTADTGNATSSEGVS